MSIYYVSSSYTGGIANGGINTPWKSLSAVQSNMNVFQPGDFIFFKKGDTFTGHLTITKQGTIGSPITFSTYGTGADPVMKNVGEETFQLGAYNNGGGYITIDGFNFTDTTFDVNDKINHAPCETGIRLGYFPDYKKTGCIIKNCKFSNIGSAVVITGNETIVENCDVRNMKNVVNTTSPNYEDYGANPFTITGDDNIIQDNYISGGWAESLDFGFNGGAFEMFDSCNRNQFLRNTIVDCGGIAEFGAQSGDAVSVDNTYSYNTIINCGNLSYINFSGQFTCTATNVQFFNNIIIENSASRFSGPNTGMGITTPAALAKISPEPALLTFGNGSPNTTIFNFKNNIVLLQNGNKVIQNNTVETKTVHTNNIYKLTGGSILNMTLTGSELSNSTANLFVNQGSTGSDPLTWDLHPVTGSPSINFGTPVGYTIDKDGVAVSNPPEAGTYEFVPVTTTTTLPPTTTTTTTNQAPPITGTVILQASIIRRRTASLSWTISVNRIVSSKIQRFINNTWTDMYTIPGGASRMASGALPIKLPLALNQYRIKVVDSLGNVKISNVIKINDKGMIYVG